jgi:hypothetical protein
MKTNNAPSMKTIMSALFDESGSLILPERPQTESQYSPSVNAFEICLPSWVGTNWGHGDETVFSHMSHTGWVTSRVHIPSRTLSRIMAYTLSVASRRRNLLDIFESTFVAESPHCDLEYIQGLGGPRSIERHKLIIEWLDEKIWADVPRWRLAQTKWECDRQWFLSHVPLPITARQDRGVIFS